MIRSVCLLLLSIFFISCKKEISNTTVNKMQIMLQTLSASDRSALDRFWGHLIHDYNYAYTLFGDKPISLASYSLKPNAHATYYPDADVVFREGWKTWCCCTSQFVSKQFVLKRNLEECGHIYFYLINKSAVLNTIKKYLVVFQHQLGPEIDAATLTEQLCDPNGNLLATIKNSSELYGILLGYGQENAWKFGRKVNLCHLINVKANPPLQATVEGLLNPLAKYLAELYNYSGKQNEIFSEETEIALAEELNTIMDQQAGWELLDSDYFLDKFIAPMYMSSKEGLQQPTQVDFVAIRENIRKHYQQGDFLEVTLNQFMNDN